LAAIAAAVVGDYNLPRQTVPRFEDGERLPRDPNTMPERLPFIQAWQDNADVGHTPYSPTGPKLLSA